MFKNLAYFVAGAVTWTLTSVGLLTYLVQKDPDFIQRTDRLYKGTL